MHKNKVEKALTGRAPCRILDFPQDRLADLDMMIFDGLGDYKIATHIQKEWGFYPGKTQKTVVRHVQLYRESDLGKSRVSELENQQEKVIESRFDRRVDVMRELEDLFITQLTRIKKSKEKEDQMPGLLMDQVSNAMKDAVQTGSMLAKLQLATGVIAKAPTKVSGVVTDDHGKQHPFSWTAATEAMYQKISELDGHSDKQD